MANPNRPPVPLAYGNIEADVCVVGRCDFSSGIGQLTFAFAEMFSRSFTTCVQPTEAHLRSQNFITLPNGRNVPVWRPGWIQKASIFVDVFWNGTHDRNFLLAPQCGIRLACLVWDSDELPAEWVTILNTRFDAAVCTSPHLIETARRSGVKIPCVCVPPGLDLEPLLAKPVRTYDKKLRVGCVAAFHPRKNTTLLVDAFLDAFAGKTDVELVVHSNVAFPAEIERVRRHLRDLGADNVTISTENLSAAEKDSLIESFDVFANLSRGEGYSIGPREALALGKVCVLSNVGGHQELGGTEGVFLVEPSLSLPARFPEIDNRIFGEQKSVSLADASRVLREAVDYVRSGESQKTILARRDRAADFSLSRLSDAAANLIVTDLDKYRVPRHPLPEVDVGDDYKAMANVQIKFVGGLSSVRHKVIQAHDGGYFSLFNCFFSHLVWDQQDQRCHRTLPDWDVNRFIARQKGAVPQSFCYGKPEDGNIWTKLYKPLFGLSEHDMQQEEILYDHATRPAHIFNENREPLLTYVNAAQLYEESWFKLLRRQYSRIYNQHIILHDDIQAEVDKFTRREFRDHTIIGAHVRHPSHTVEQPNAVIAHADEYINRINRLAVQRGLERRSDKWRVFLATDQERVVERFRAEYGDRLAIWENARRTTDQEDSVFDNLDSEAKNVDGYQLQHIVARDTRNWSVDMAREVVRDAALMSKCQTLLHVVSNVSTAVSYMNPDIEMMFFRA